MREHSLEPGVYSELITHALSSLLGDSDADERTLVASLRNAEAPDRLSRHVAAVVSRLIASLDETTRADDGTKFIGELIGLLDQLRPGSGVLDDLVEMPPRVLEGVRVVRPDGSLAPLDLPLTPLPDTTVLTNAPGEPAIPHELTAEIPSAANVDVLMAFVRWSGVGPLLPALRRHCEEGRRIRLLTTTYTNSTEARALDALTSEFDRARPTPSFGRAERCARLDRRAATGDTSAAGASTPKAGPGL